MADHGTSGPAGWRIRVDFDELRSDLLTRLQDSLKGEELKDIARHLIREIVKAPIVLCVRRWLPEQVLYLPTRSLKDLSLSVHSLEMVEMGVVEMETDVTVEILCSDMLRTLPNDYALRRRKAHTCRGEGHYSTSPVQQPKKCCYNLSDPLVLGRWQQVSHTVMGVRLPRGRGSARVSGRHGPPKGGRVRYVR